MNPRLKKKTPTQMGLDDLKLPVSDDRFDRAVALFARHVGGRFDRSSGIVHLPWKKNGDKTFPTKIQVMYRKFPCGFLHKKFTPSSGLPCVSFDIIPLGVSNPSKSRMFRSFQGPASDAKRLFNLYLLWLKKVADALKLYAQRNPLDKGRLTKMMARRAARKFLAQRKRPIYLGVFLTPQSIRQIIQQFGQEHPDLKNDHLTLVFKPSDSDLESATIGQRIKMKVVGYAVDQKGQAIAIELPSNLTPQSKNRHPHITISVAKGTKPVYSNELLAKGPIQPVSPMTIEGVVDVFPRTLKAASIMTDDITRRVASRFLQADLMPPLGYPGGQCHVVQRIVDEIRSPRLEQSLREQVESGKDLPNPAARKVYDPEKTKGAWKFDMMITPHAQYRMDLRGITEPEVRRALGNAFKTINNERSQGHLERYDRLMRGGEIEYYDERLDVFLAFTVRNKTAVIITTYRKKEKDPKRPTTCPV